MSPDPLRIYEFGPFRLDVAERQLLRDGSPVPLTPKAFEILCVLVRRGGHLVSKDELIKVGWPDSFVEEGSLARNIYILRKALGDGAENQSYIKTVARAGYRFVAPVRVVAAEGGASGPEEAEAPTAFAPTTGSLEAASAAPTPGAPRPGAARPKSGRPYALRLLIVLGVLLSAAAALYLHRAEPARGGAGGRARSLAVLPFRMINGQAGDEQAGLGMADALITKLGRLPDVTVLPTASVFAFGGRDRDPVAAGRALGVDAVLDATVQRSGDGVRVSAQLVSTADGRTLWADEFEEPRAEIFAIQDAVSGRLAPALASQIGSGRPGMGAARYSANPDATESYLMGFYFWNRKTKDNIARAIPYLRRAIELDPNFALAHATLADCYFIDARYSYNIFPAEESYREARASARRALELDGMLGEPHVVMAQIKSDLDGDPTAAEAEYRRALALSPGSATGHVRYGYHLLYSSRLDEAIGEVKRGRELDPLSPAANGALCFMLLLARDYDGAIKFGRRALELNALSPVVRVNLGEAYLHKGMYREAFDLFEQLSGDDPLLGLQCLIRAHALAGEPGKARALLSNLRRSPDGGGLTPMDMAAIQASLGESGKAFGLLEKTKLGAQDLALLRFDPQWDVLRANKRFADLLARYERTPDAPATPR